LNFYDDPPQLNIEEIGLDSLRISWNKSPYNAKYRLKWNNSNILYFDEPEDTMCTIPQIGFGNFADFNLDTRSKYFSDWPDVSYSYNISSSKRYFNGIQLICANSPDFGYNYAEKVVYSNEYDQMRCFDIDDYSVISTADVVNLMYYGRYSCPTNSTKVAAIGLTDLYIFEDKELKNPIVINYSDVGSNIIDHFLLTDNDLVALAYNNMYKLINVKTRQTILSTEISDYPYYSKWACISTSQDSKYMCTATCNGIIINKIQDGKLEMLFSDNRNYSSAYFNPLNPNELFLTLRENEGIEIRNPSNFELLDKINTVPGMVIQNIDPETNNLLITDYENLSVINIKTHNVLLRLPCTEYKCWLFNNHIFANSGFVLDISKRIE